MTLLDPGPCQNWCPIWCTAVDAELIPVTGSAVQAATEILWALSGRQFGECEVTLRPCRRDCYDPTWWPLLGGNWTDVSGWSWPFPVLLGGAWFNLGCGGCPGTCSCSMVSEAVLPSPVSGISQIKIDGVVLPAAGNYRVDNNRLLVRLGGEQWPLCNDLSKDDTELGTWSVTATYGLQVPTSGQFAVGELALELAKACLNKPCRLPRSVTEVARQGVTMRFTDPTQVFPNRRTGLYWPDLFIAAVNPHGLTQRSRVYDIDAPEFRRPNT